MSVWCVPQLTFMGIILLESMSRNGQMIIIGIIYVQYISYYCITCTICKLAGFYTMICLPFSCMMLVNTIPKCHPSGKIIDQLGQQMSVRKIWNILPTTQLTKFVKCNQGSQVHHYLRYCHNQSDTNVFGIASTIILTLYHFISMNNANIGSFDHLTYFGIRYYPRWSQGGHS